MTAVIDAGRRRVRLDPRDPAFFDDPYPAYAAIRAAAPAFFWEDYGLWCFAAHADVSALLRDRRFGRQILQAMSRDELGWPPPKAHLAPFDALERCSILEMEPPEHTRLRTLVNRAFVSRQVEKLAPRIAALAHARIDAIAAAGAAELIEAFATPIPVAVIADLLGVPRALGPQLLDWSHRMVAMYRFGVTRSVEESAAAAAGEFAEFMRGYARARRVDLGDDLISQLLVAESEEGRLSEDELVATCILLLNAGHEATVHAIGNAVKTILERRLDPRTIFADEQGDRGGGRGTAATRPAAASLHPLRARGRRGFGGPLAEGRQDRPPARGGQSRSRALSRPGRVRSPARSQSPCGVRGGDPLLPRRAARPARNGDGAADPVRAPARPAARRASAHSRRLPLSRARGAEGYVGLAACPIFAIGMDPLRPAPGKAIGVTHCAGRPRNPFAALGGEEGGAIGRRKTPVFDGLWRRMRDCANASSLAAPLTPALSPPGGARVKSG